MVKCAAIGVVQYSMVSWSGVRGGGGCSGVIVVRGRD